MWTVAGEELIVSGEFHIVPNLPCGMIIGTDILKPNNIDICWGSPDVAVIGDKGQVPIRVTRSDKVPRIETPY